MSEQTNATKTIEEQIVDYQTSGDFAMRDAIHKQTAYIAEILAKRYVGRGIEYEDLYQVASIGLLYAIDRFDSSRNVKFTTYATKLVTGEIKKHFRDTGHFIKIPRRMYEAFSHADFSKDAKPYSVVSYEQTLGENRSAMLKTLIGQSDDSFLLIEDKSFIYQCLQLLTGEEHTFIMSRYYDGMTQKQVAEKMRVSQMYISRLEKKVLKKLYNYYMKD